MNAVVASFASAARYKLTLEDARAMQAAGVFGDRKFELIDGELIELVDMGRSINWNAAIARWLYEALLGRRDLVIVPDKTLALSDNNGPKPDFWVFPDAIANPEDVRGPDVLLAIEVSDTTLEKDLVVKGALYEEHGVREYWVVDCAARQVHVHVLGPNGYGPARVYGAEAAPSATLVAGLSLRINDLTRV